MAWNVTLSRDEKRLLLDVCGSETSWNQYRVLVLHDEAAELQRLSCLLQRDDFKVDLCCELPDALWHCQCHAYDLVIAGHRQSELDGVNFLSEVRDLQPGAYRFLVDGCCDKSVLMRAINTAGVHAVIEPSWDDRVLHQLVDRLFAVGSGKARLGGL